jgi:metal-responsive CopG/Arc/MetJ family transcriptional regulator
MDDTVHVPKAKGFQRAATREDHRVTTVSLPEALHEALAILAVKRRAAMTELIREAIAEYLKRAERVSAIHGTKRRT